MPEGIALNGRGGGSAASRAVEVACPRCDQLMRVSVPSDHTELHVRPYVGLYGEYTTARCPDDHKVWIYYC